MFDIVAPWGSTTRVSNCDDRELPAGSASRTNHAGQSDDDLFVMEADGSELGRSLVIRALAIRALGILFQWLAVVPAAIGTVRIMELLRGAENSRLVGVLDESSRRVLQPRTENEFSRLAILVGLPVLLAVVGAWLCFRLGSSLKNHSPRARWMAVSLLAAASVPPQTLFFQALWGRAIGMAAATCLMTAMPASFAWILSASTSDILFISMKNVEPWFARRGRGLVRLLGVLAVVGTAYAWAFAGHSKAVSLVSAAKQQIARADCLAAVQSLDAALRADRYVSYEAYLLRGTAINGAISTNGAFPPGHGRRDALADIEWFLESAPNNGEAHYQRGCALAGLADVKQARAAFARAIPLLSDPTDALVDAAALSFHVFDYATAAKQITLAIERRPLVPEYYEQRALYRTFLPDFRGAHLDNARADTLRASPNAAALAEVEGREHDPGNQPVTARQDTPAVRAALARLAGDWDVVRREPDRRTADDPTPRTLIFQFHDGDLSIVRDGQRDRYGSYRVEPDDAHQRVRIDLTRPLDGRASTMRGVYDIRDDVLRLCVADEGGSRPTAFTTKGLFGVTFYTMKRTSQ
jgi:uncharacterized protein (TIGR03067 family)